MTKVEHGGKFNHYPVGFAQQESFELGHIRLTVGNGNGFSAVLIAAGGVEKDTAPSETWLQIGYSVVVSDTYMVEVECGKVVGCYGAEFCLTFYVSSRSESGGEERAVDSESSGPRSARDSLLTGGLLYNGR